MMRNIRALAFALAACLLLAVQACAPNVPAVYVQPVRAVNAAGDLAVTRYGGVVESQKTDNVTADSDKTVKSVAVQAGDHVDVGDVLFTYDTDAGSLEVQKGELEIERLDSTISDGHSQIDELQRDLSRASGGDAAQLSAQIAQLQADVAQAEYDRKVKAADVDRLRASLADPDVRAKTAGTVQQVRDPLALTGDPESGMQGDSDALVTILADGDLRVRGKVSEQNIYDVSAGTRVIVRSRVDATVTWGGQVASVETSPEQQESQMYFYDSGSGEGASNYRFYVDLDDSAGLMLGQHVTIELDWGQQTARSGIWLDEGWLVQDDGGAYVWAARGAGEPLEQRSVQLGERDEELGIVQVAAGLDEGDYLAWPDESCAPGAPTTTDLSAVQGEGDLDAEGAGEDDLGYVEAEGDWDAGDAMLEDGIALEGAGDGDLEADGAMGADDAFPDGSAGEDDMAGPSFDPDSDAVGARP